MLDAGCGSGRLTVALAEAGAEVTGFDTNATQLEEARGARPRRGVALELLVADFNGALPFADASFDAVVEPALRHGCGRSGRNAARARARARAGRPDRHGCSGQRRPRTRGSPFRARRSATCSAPERAAFARAFGKLGDPDDAAAAHRAAGFVEVEAVLLHGSRSARDAAAYWQELSGENGHFRRVEAALSDEERAALVAELDERLAPYREAAA